MSPITSHVLDTGRGRPAKGVLVTLSLREASGTFLELVRGQTDADGRIKTLLPDGFKLKAGVYQLVFDTGAYYAALGATTFYPSVSIVFEVARPDEHYHVPLLISPFGYSTYRGS